VRVRARNLGTGIWEASGARRSVVEALVVDATGNPRVEPEPARWAYPVPPGGSATAGVRIVAPALPGRYTALLGLARRGSDGSTLAPGPVARFEFSVVDSAHRSRT